ncbi:MAG TPA: 4-hydroxy-tetrahydrodipicolinate synthase [Terricaulis sp.]|nr:4-hydroxy-tetrahydrodipicolinate synthase [Terricaulis sp.]
MINGSIPALITPFRDGKVDEARFQRFVDWQIGEGSSALVPCGTTGESSTLSLEEHVRVVELCVEAAGRRVPVIAGAGSNDTATAVDLTRAAKEAGADAVLLVAPYYNRPSQEGLYQHYKAISEAADIPMVIYNVPTRTVVDIAPETLGRIAKLANVIGVKDASGDLARVARHRELCGENFIQLSGNDDTAVEFCELGGVGCISVTANVAPKLCAEMQAALRAGDGARARAINAKLANLHRAMFVEPSPAPAKYAASLLDRASEDVRLPIIPCSDSAKAAVRAAMAEAGLL